jgi:hypothetical protein
VAVVDAYDQPYAESDLAAYRSQYGMTACTTANGCFRKVDQRGGTNYPELDYGWGSEIDLDIQMVSAICPQCHILLVEADSDDDADMAAAEDRAASLGATSISNSYGDDESSAQLALDSHYNHPGIAVTASSGDDGYGVEFPAASRYVVSVGGTTLTSASNARGWTETAWDGSGSGCSAYESKPAWQSDSGCSHRTVADVAAVADPNTGVAAYDPDYGGWGVWGGTSVASPIIASIAALAHQPASASYPASDIYASGGGLNDVTSGSNGSCSPSYLCVAVAGYDGPTGLGTPSGLTAFSPGARIQGTVTGTSGARLGGISVSALSSSFSTSGVTASDGTYSLAATAGSYTVSFSDPGNQYRAGYYGAAGYVATIGEASPVVVGLATVTGISVQLPAVAKIRGTVAGSDSTALAGIDVEATSGSTVIDASTGADGTFALAAPAGSYTIQFSDPTGVHQSGYYSSTGYTSSSGSATPVVVDSDDVAGIDVQLPDAPALTGSFLSMTSQPGDWIGAGQTYYLTPATSGFYGSHGGSLVELHAGDWTLDFAAPSGQPLNVGTYSNVARYPFQSASQPGLSISGDGRGCNTLTGSFTVLRAVYGTGSTILQFDATFIQYCEGGTPALTGEIAYDAPASLVLSPATATVVAGVGQAYTAEGFDAAHNDIGDVTGSTAFKIDSNTCSGAVCSSLTSGPHTVTATNGSATGTAALNVFMPHISGTVTSGTAGLAAIIVKASNATTGASYAQTVTGSDGTWSMPALPGSYKVSFSDPAAKYPSGYLGSSGFTIDPAAATTVVVTTSDVTGQDAALPVGYHVSGSVTDAGANALGSMTVAAIDATTLHQVVTTTTDTTGKYAMLLPVGTYTISFFDPTGIHQSGYYGSGGYTDAADSSTPVAIDSGDVGSISVQLPTAPALTGSFLSMTSQPGDWAGGGKTYYFTPAMAGFSGSHNGSLVVLSAGGWTADFAAPSGQSLTVGTYSNVARYPFQSASQPGLSVYGGGCNTVTGSFTVLRAVYGADNTILQFDATFIQHCEGVTPALTGEIAYVAPASLVLSPATATVVGGVGQIYTAEGFDAAHNDIGDVTASTTFKIDSTACAIATCSSTVGGPHTVTGTYASATGTATLNVYLPPISGKATKDGTVGIGGITVKVTNAADGSTYAQTVTGSDGAWSAPTLPGAYQVAFSDPAGKFASGYLGSSGFTDDPTAAKTVTVTTSEVSGQDVILPLGHHVGGRVTDAGSVAIGAVTVTALDSTTLHQAGLATTDTSGNYSMLLPSGRYVVFFSDSTGEHQMGYYGAAGFTAAAGSAAPIVVASGDVTGISVHLPAAPPMTGSFLTMTSQPGDDIGGGGTYDYTTAVASIVGSGGGSTVAFAVATPGYAHWWYVDLAAPSGQGLIKGTYLNATRYPFQAAGNPGLSVYGDGRGCDEDAGSFTVLRAVYGADNTILQFDATFIQHCEGVTPALTGEIAYVAPASLVLSPATATVVAGVGQAYTAEGFDAAHNDIGDVTASTTFKIDSTTCSSATCSSTIVGPHTITGTYATATGTAGLFVGTTAISGKVTNGSTGLSGIDVEVDTAADGSYYDDVLTGSDGTWSLGVAPGSYAVSFYDDSGTYADGYLGASGFTNDPNAAKTITVKSANVTGQNVVLPKAVAISGTVTNGKAGLADIDVEVDSAADGSYYDDVLTEADGTWSIPVAPGSYTVTFTDDSGTYASGYLGKNGFTYDPNSAATVIVTNATVGGKNVVLPAALHISGTVTDTSSNALSGIDVYAYDSKTMDPVAYGMTDDDGTYSMAVAPGTYLVEFSDSAGTYPSGYWSKSGFTDDVGTADSVTVTKADVPAINAALPTGYVISGVVTDQSDLGIGDIEVDIYNTSDDLVASAYTEDDGSYSVVVAPGPHTVAFVDDSGTYADGYWDGSGFNVEPASARQFSGAHSGVDVVMPPGLSGPLDVTAVALAGSATVSWSAPTHDGESSITGYTVTSSPDSKQCKWTSGPLSCTVLGLTDFQPYTFIVAATNGVGATANSDPSASVTPLAVLNTYHTVAPVRLLDTRIANGLSGKLTAGVPGIFQITGRGGASDIPNGATAVTANVTIVKPSAASSVYLGPAPIAHPATATINFNKADTTAYGSTISLAADGTMSATYMASSGTTDLLVDVTGYFTPDESGDTYHALAPARLLDTRIGNGQSKKAKLKANVPITFTIAGRGGVPANAVAVTGNVTVANASNGWAVYVGPTPLAKPPASTMNFVKGQVRANSMTVALSSKGTLSATFLSSGKATTDLVFDVTGYYTADLTGAKYVPITTPVTILDTRSGIGSSGRISANTPRTFTVRGSGGVPAIATGITGIVAVYSQTNSWAVFVGPTSTAKPSTSSMNFVKGDNCSNGFTVSLSSAGGLSVTFMSGAGNSSNVGIVVTGYFVP